MDKSDLASGLALTRADLIASLARYYTATSEEQISKLDARFKSLQKVDLPSGNRPTKGQRGRYTLQQIGEVFICFELARYGLDAFFVTSAFVGSEEWQQASSALASTVISEIALEKVVSLPFEYALIEPRGFFHEKKGSLKLCKFEELQRIMLLESSGICFLNLLGMASKMAECFPRQQIEKVAPKYFKYILREGRGSKRIATTRS